MALCTCGSEIEFDQCCGPILSGEAVAKTAEALMRSRFSAYVTEQISYLGESLHPDHRSDYDEAATERWAKQSSWVSLEVQSVEAGGEQDNEGTVDFIARFKEKGLVRQHRELARFKKHSDRWYYVDGEMPKAKTVINDKKVGRNDPCSCGSGKKFKKCCG